MYYGAGLRENMQQSARIKVLTGFEKLDLFQTLDVFGCIEAVSTVAALGCDETYLFPDSERRRTDIEDSGNLRDIKISVTVLARFLSLSV